MTYFWACNCSFISCKCGSGVLFYHTYSFIGSFIQWFINSFSSICFTVLRNTTKNSWSVYLLSGHAGSTHYTLHSSTGPINSFRYTRSPVQVTLHQHSARRKWKKYYRASPAAVTGQWPGKKLWLTYDRTVVRDARRLVICSILYLQSDQQTAMVLVQLFIFLIFGTKKNELLV